MKMEATYEDLYDNPATLTENEMSWFETICRRHTEKTEELYARIQNNIEESR